jgi:hypothetical protein
MQSAAGAFFSNLVFRHALAVEVFANDLAVLDDYDRQALKDLPGLARAVREI